MYNIVLSLSRPRSLTWRVARKLGLAKPLPTPQELIQRFSPGRTFADIGCMWGVNGAMSFYAEQCGAAHVIAVDISPATEEFNAEHDRSRSNVSFVQGDINETATLSAIGKTDVVFCSGVLYHLPDPFSLLVRLRAICNETLILRTMIIPEVPGQPNAAVFYPFLDGKTRDRFRLGTGMQMAITGPFEPESGYGNWFWGMTPSCVASLLACAGFTVTERYLEPFCGWFICRTAEVKFSAVGGDNVALDDPRFTQHVHRMRPESRPAIQGRGPQVP